MPDRSQPTICILAAGRGTRLGDATADLPKAMLPVDGRSILQRQLEAIAAAGVEDDRVIIVTGHAAHRIEQHSAGRYHTLHNPDFARFNNIYSVHLLESVVRDDLLLINGDTLFHPAMLAALLQMPAAADATLVIDDVKPLGEEEMKVQYEAGRLARIGKDLDPRRSTGEYIGLLRFRGDALVAYYAALRQLIAAGRTGEWYEAGFNVIADRVAIAMTPTGGLPWIEVDTPADAAKALDVIARQRG